MTDNQTAAKDTASKSTDADNTEPKIIETSQNNANSVSAQNSFAQVPAQKVIADTIIANTKALSDTNKSVDSKHSNQDTAIKASAREDTTKNIYSKIDQPNSLKANNRVATDTKATNNNIRSNAVAPEPEIKKFNIAIAGVSYPVFCPVDEEDELRAAEHYINDFTTRIKKDAPKMSQENLLVLACLTLHEKMSAYEKATNDRQQQDKQNEFLLNEIIRDAQSIL